MKFTDIIIAIVALLLAFYIIGLIFKLFWLMTILIIAYIIYIFLKKSALKFRECSLLLSEILTKTSR